MLIRKINNSIWFQCLKKKTTNLIEDKRKYKVHRAYSRPNPKKHNFEIAARQSVVGLLQGVFLNFCCLVTVALVVRLICNRMDGCGNWD